MKIHLIGLPASGKTTVAEHLISILNFPSELNRNLFGSEFRYCGIDDLRHMYSDGSQDGEDLCYSRYKEKALYEESNLVMECTGYSKHFKDIHSARQGKDFFVLLDCSKDECRSRANLRTKALPPSPYGGDIATSINDLSEDERLHNFKNYTVFSNLTSPERSAKLIYNALFFFIKKLGENKLTETQRSKEIFNEIENRYAD